MANVLSQDEVDSLLNGIGEGEVQTEADTPEKEEGLPVYDFSRQASGPIHLRMPTLGIINERLVGFLKTSLSAATGSPIDVNVDIIESIRFGKFHRSIPVPTSLNIFRMEPLRGFAMLVMEGALVFAFVDTLFGGKSVKHVKLEGKGFTRIEVKIIDKIVKVILKDMQKAWSDVYPMEMAFARSEVDPQFAGIATPEDMVIAIKFTVDFRNFSGIMTLCIPYATIEPIREKLKYRFQSEQLETDQSWIKYFQEKIKEAPVDVSCILGGAKITGRDLLELKVDDVIQLDQKVTDPVIVAVEGSRKFNGYTGVCNKKKAVRIDGRLDKE